MAGGAILAMPFAAAIVNHFGSRRVAQVSGVAVCLLFLFPTLSPTLPVFIVGNFLYGFFTGSWEIGINAQGVAAEKRVGRPIMSSLHGAFSVGGIIGAVAGGFMIQLVGAPPQAIVAVVASIAVLAVAWPNFLPADVDKGLSEAPFGWPTKASIGLGVLTLVAMMSEGAIVDWSAIFLRDTYGLLPGNAALGYGLFSTGMTVSRLSGDHVRHRMGAVVTIQVSAVLTAVGMAVTLLSPSPVFSIGALLLVGLGIGNFVPVFIAAAGKIDPHAPARAIAATTAIGYCGFVAGPPLIGISADWIGLGPSLAVIIVSALVTLVFSGMARGADHE